jgi:hypothetical protein
MTNKRDLKAFVRYDGSGRVVAGSLILRRQKPKVGKWTEIQGYKCCNQNQAPVLVTLADAFPTTFSSFRIIPDDGNFNQTIVSYTILTAADVDELAAIFNASFRNLGFFAVVSGDLYYTPSIQIAEFYTANQTTLLLATAFAD